MANKRRYIDVLSTRLTFAENSVSNITFADILHFMDGKEYRYSEKIFEFSLLNTTIPNCIVGIIETTQDKDIPPIKDKRTKQFSRVNINPTTQGLAFANIFLYDVQRNILLYEINKNGCFPKQLSEFIGAKWNAENQDVRFELTFPAIFRVNEYQRMLQMEYYKRITVELYKPNELINCFDENTDSLENNFLKHNLQISTQNNADTMKLEQVAMTKKLNPMGLSRSLVKGVVDAIKLNIADRGFVHNIQKLKIEGYTSDPENRALKPINILADTFDEHFKITGVLVQSDVQRGERKIGIEEVYNRILPELRQLTR